ncbi:hypothetical protein IWX84_000474 [Flavobacterium sp. CG_9.10]|uniref:zinc ribbon domain-containing protein n=1 Tax=Flavobacterium sp. CG_9.10 TaxID=2787729 RepID=UPI0018C9835F|nr:zinc ribbon domain-containing protein [Flavobacterium sp. CG_9.10]MBG6109615.1 hypothetical protein [Flavobacterium sp. CG_9.10]
MENIVLCQSCGMPLDKEELKGTEQNGFKNEEYCKYCYENGNFKKPTMNLEDMKDTVSTQMKKLKLPIYTIQKAINILPTLKRWNGKN